MRQAFDIHPQDKQEHQSYTYYIQVITSCPASEPEVLT